MADWTVADSFPRRGNHIEPHCLCRAGEFPASFSPT